MIISPADIVSVEDTSGASALDATSAPGAAPVEAEAEELAPPRPLWRQRALLALGVAAAMATAIAVSSTFARRDPPGREPAKALTGTAEEREAPPKPSATAPPVVGSVREPDRRSAVSRAPSRISRQKSSPGQKTAATRKLPAKRQPNSRQGS